MSDRALWLAEWCPTCAASAGARCRALRVRGPARPRVARRAGLASADVPEVPCLARRSVRHARRVATRPGLTARGFIPPLAS